MRAAVAVHVASLALAAVVVVLECNRQWFIGDEWDFLLGRRLTFIDEPPGSSLLAPHNEHWSTLPILVWRALWQPLGASHYAVYALPMIALHLLLTHILWRFMQRLGSAIWVATAFSAAFGVLGAGAEDLTWAFQLGFVGSAAFGMLAVRSAERAASDPARRWPAGAWLWAVLSLICSNMGVPMVAAAGLVAVARSRLRLAITVVLPPAIVFVAWYAAIGHHGVRGTGLSVGDVLVRLPRFVYVGLANSLHVASGGLPDSGGVLLLALIAWFVVLGWRTRSGRVAAALVVAAALLYGVVGMGRVQLGVEEARASRYAYLAICLMLPAFALAVTDVARRLPRHRTLSSLALAVSVALLAVNLHRLHAESGVRAAQTQQERRQVMAAVRLLNGGARLPGTFATAAEGIPATEFARLARAGRLPVHDVSPQDLVDERALLGVAVGPTPTHSRHVTFGVPIGANNCVRRTSFAYLPVAVGPQGASIRLEPPNPRGVAVVYLRSGAGRLTTVPSSPAGGRWVNVDPSPYGTVYLAPTDGELSFCIA